MRDRGLKPTARYLCSLRELFGVVPIREIRVSSLSALFLVSLRWPPMIAWGSLEWAWVRVIIKIIIVVLLVLMGVGLIALTPVANVYVSNIGFKAPRSVLASAEKNEVATTNFARLMQLTGVMLILSGLGIGLLWRVKAPADSL